MYLPENIHRMISGQDHEMDTVGMSDSQVLRFENMVLKIESKSRQTENEVEMMNWLKGKLPVPEILLHENEGENSFLLMSRIEGMMLCDERILCNPNKLTDLLAEAVDMLWSVDISDIPANVITLEEKLRIASERVSAGKCSTYDTEPDTYGSKGFESPEKLLHWLIDNKPEEQLVLSHGDFCLPNIFECNGKVNGFIDLGRCGVSDKYQDIALCWRSLCHNYDGRYGTPAVDDFDPNNLF